MLTIVIGLFLKTFFSPFIQQMLIEHLFCARHYVRCARPSKPLIAPDLMEFMVEWGIQTQQHTPMLSDPSHDENYKGEANVP